MVVLKMISRGIRAYNNKLWTTRITKIITSTGNEKGILYKGGKHFEISGCIQSGNMQY